MKIIMVTTTNENTEYIITINYFNLQLPEKKIKATRINIAISVFAILITVINIIVTSFDPDDVNDSYNV